MGKSTLSPDLFLDVTERKRAENALYESEQKYRVALHQRPEYPFSSLTVKP